VKFSSSIATDVLIAFAVAALAGITVSAIGSPSAPGHMAPLIGVVGLAVVAFGLLGSQLLTRADHLRATQSDLILRVARETLEHLSEGSLDCSAQAVCDIILEHADHVAAVEISDATGTLGFAGLGRDHHGIAGAQPTDLAEGVLRTGETATRVAWEYPACSVETCPLKAVIASAVEANGQPVGVLSFYFTTHRMLNESQVTMAQGLAALISTQLKLSEFERQSELATRMELRALQAQVNPHFLFNMLNTIASHIRTDPDQARSLVRRFGAFYRRTLENAEEPVTLAVELGYVETYVELEQARFGDGLVLVRDVAADTFNIAMPAFLIQPLVENAVVHGMPADGRPLTVTVSAKVRGSSVIVSVTDDGVGMSATALQRVFEPGFGTGLGIALPNIRDRVRGFYGPGSGVEVRSKPGLGTTVALTLTETREVIHAL
jgi:two-component system sensor histidine kinase LytS